MSEKIPLKGQPIVVYDLEIKNAIDGQKVTWTSFSDMGISVGVSFDYRSGDFRTFFDDNLEELVGQLKSAKLIVGFNHIGFDNKLLRAQVGTTGEHLLPNDEELTNYDILVESRRAMGWKPGDRFPSGMKLDNHLEAMFGKEMLKTEDGAQAPVLYQQKKWGPLVSYCIADVRRTCMVFENIWNEGWVATALHGKQMVKPPQSVMGLSMTLKEVFQETKTATFW